MWHEHYDLLNLVLYGYGKYVAPDLGSDARSNGYTPLRTYHYAQAVAHNTVNVDEYIHKKTPGKLDFIGVTERFKVATADSGDAYRVALKDQEGLLSYNVDFERTVALVDDVYVVVRDRLRGRDGIPHRYDWCLHALGDFSVDTRPVETEKFFRGPGYGYSQIAWKKFYRLAGTFSGGWRDGDTGLRIFVPGVVDTLLATGLAPVPSHGDKALKEGSNPTHKALLARGGIDKIILRKENVDADYLVVLEPYRENGRIRSVTPLSSDIVRVVRLDGSGETVRLGPDRSDSWLVREDRGGEITGIYGFNLTRVEASGRRLLESDVALAEVSLTYDQDSLKGTIRTEKDAQVRLLCRRAPVSGMVDGRDCPVSYQAPWAELKCAAGSRRIELPW